MTDDFQIFAHGEDFSPEEFLAATALDFDGMWQRGERDCKTSGVFKTLGDGHNTPFREQEEIAIAFLAANSDELKKLAGWPGVKYFILGLQWQEDLREGVVGFALNFSDRLMELALDIGVQPNFYVTLNRLDFKEEDPDAVEEECPRSPRSNIPVLPDERSLPTLLTTGFLVEGGLSPDQFGQIEDKLTTAANSGIRHICRSIPKTRHLGCWAYTALDPDEANCFRCERCGHWATDINEPEQLLGLLDGYMQDGKMMCSQCYTWEGFGSKEEGPEEQD